MKHFQNNETKSVLLFWVLLLGIVQSFAQSGSYGSTYIGAGGEIAIIGVQHTFNSSGMISSARTPSPGYVSFSNGATYTGATGLAHVDGYVRTYMPSSFTFPIGNGSKLRVASVSESSSANPTDAAYYSSNPTSAGYSNTSVEAGVTSVSTTEYWDINGITAATITLTWDASSSISNVNNVKIVGWDGSKWVNIPAIVGAGATTSSGSITTSSTVVPNTYAVYTLAGLSSTLTFTGSGLGVSTGTPNVSVSAGTNVTQNAANELLPSGGVPPYVYSNGSSDPTCVAPSGATALTGLIVNPDGTYSYTAPSTAGQYYYCIKVCDSSSVPICRVAVYTLTVTSNCLAGNVAPVPR